ncbi:hypothetical protein PHMEG_00022660 [Phytophthora megakarya]|uniref:Uncharacterized protein n=1 Tax=Phytophthora megakarya TaxID=4795 RepID=A0A225VJT8_9STRA|nr:hypothetical protein PHMEG_00022660 [Phytophthora megakarya]
MSKNVDPTDVASELKAMFPADLPMEYPIGQKYFYERKCYRTYYDMVIDLLFKTNKTRVDVTGTSGIGTSVFYGYFFNRFMSLNRNYTIITASFSEPVISVALFKGNKLLGKCQGRSAYECMVLKAKRAKRGGSEVIGLYDGPPEIVPSNPWKKVCFAVANEEWFAMMSNYDTVHAIVGFERTRCRS